MITYIRILLHVVAGWLLASGWINEEIRDMIVNDPEIASVIQVAIAGLIHLATVIWWRFAKWRGWST